jgi:hypothetical protein
MAGDPLDDAVPAPGEAGVHPEDEHTFVTLASRHRAMVDRPKGAQVPARASTAAISSSTGRKDMPATDRCA